MFIVTAGLWYTGGNQERTDKDAEDSDEDGGLDVEGGAREQQRWRRSWLHGQHGDDEGVTAAAASLRKGQESLSRHHLLEREIMNIIHLSQSL